MDFDIIDDGFKSISYFKNADLMPHFIYCGNFHNSEGFEYQCLEKMKKYGIQSAILTSLRMLRQKLVTKEKVKLAYKGKLKNDEGWGHFKGSINDDLETFFVNLQNGGEIKYEDVGCFFLPKLSQEELNLIEVADENHLKTYSYHRSDSPGKDVDVDAEEMKRSDSKDKYVKVHCWRETMLLTIESSPSENELTEDSSEISSDLSALSFEFENGSDDDTRNYSSEISVEETSEDESEYEPET